MGNPNTFAAISQSLFGMSRNGYLKTIKTQFIVCKIDI
jgi:hypothetical protein